MTDEQFTAWLKSESAIRCVLMEAVVQVGGVETTRYFSNKAYTTKPTDVPANTVYLPIITGGVSFTETLSLEGNASLSFGDIELMNASGERDAWLSDVWTNRSVKVFIGDVRWPRSDFRLVFDGITANIGMRNRSRLNLTLSDKMQRLNNPVSETKLGGTGKLADNLLPVLFGECHNIEPMLIDEAVHEYMVHNGPIERIIEVRDNGVPVSFTPYLSTGKFRLNQQPYGTITCSAQGDKPSDYNNNVADIVKQLVKNYGSVDKRFTDDDIDLTQFASFKAGNMQPVGLYLHDRTNVLEACAKLAGSIGAALTMTRTGLLQIVKLDLPRTTSGTEVRGRDMVDGSFEISNRPTVKAAIKLGYCKNWTVQTQLQTGIPTSHKEMFVKEWLTTTLSDDTVAAKYKSFVEPEMIETLLLCETDANAEATRRLNIWKTQRTVYKLKGLPHLLFEKLGDSLTLKHWRFLLSGGVTGQIITVTTDWLNPHIDMEVLV